MEWWDVLSVVAAFAAIGWLVKVITSPDRDADRVAEDEARAFFDRHGIWPDEVPEDRRPPKPRR